MKNKILPAIFIALLLITSTGYSSDLVFLQGNPDYNAPRVNAILKNDRSAIGIGIGLLSALNRAVPAKLFSGKSISEKGVNVTFASSGGPITHLRNPHQMVLENIRVRGSRVSFDLTVHTDEMIGITSYKLNHKLTKSGLNFFKQNQGKIVVIGI